MNINYLKILLFHWSTIFQKSCIAVSRKTLQNILQAVLFYVNEITKKQIEWIARQRVDIKLPLSTAQ
jgi:hypothetical protein